MDGLFRIQASYPTISENWFLLDGEYPTREERDAAIERKRKHSHGYACYLAVDPK